MSEAATASAPEPTLNTPASSAPSLQQLRAERARATAPSTQTVTPTPAAQVQPDPATEQTPVTAPIEMDETQLKEATLATREARQARARIKELEAKVAGSEKYTRADALRAEGKHLEAIEAAGFDVHVAVRELMSAQGMVQEDEGDPKTAELLKTIEELKDAETKRAEREKTEGAERAKAARDHDVKVVVAAVAEDAAKYPYLSRNAEWVAEAYDEASKSYPDLVKQAGRDLTPEERDRLIRAALDEHEATHAETAKRYGVVTSPRQEDSTPSRANPPKPSARPTTFDASMRGGTSNPVTKTKFATTLEEAKRQRRAGTST